LISRRAVPLVLTVLRFVLGPVFLAVYVSPRVPPGRTLLLFAIIVAAIFSDWLDGYAARRLNAVSAAGKLLPNDGSLVEVDSSLARYVEQLDTDFTRSMDDTIAFLEAPLLNRPYGEETSMGRWVTDAFRDAFGADLAFQNPGGLRKTINAGPVKIRDIWEACPFGNSMVIFELTGSEVIKLMDHLSSNPREALHVSGLTGVIDYPNKKSSDLKIGGQAIATEKKYKAVTLSYLTGHFEAYFGLKLGDRYLYDTGQIDREVLIEAARTEKTIVPPSDARLRYKN